MNKEYKKVYDLVEGLNFSCDYFKTKKTFADEKEYNLNIFQPNYKIGEGNLKYSLIAYDLEELKTLIIRLIKEYYKDKVLIDENGFIYTPIIKDNKLFLSNNVNELNLNEVKGLKVLEDD